MRTRLALTTTLLLLCCVALAQQDIPGVPDEWDALVAGLVIWLTAWLSGPATSIAKKWFKTDGFSTVMFSGALNIIAGIGFTVWAASLTRGDIPWGQAAIAALLGFVRTNGKYIGEIFAGAKALTLAKEQDEKS